MTLHELQQQIMRLAEEKHWGTNPDDVNFAEKIALIHAELSEVLEAYRQHKLTGRHGVAEELADVVVRTLHLAGIQGVAIEKEVLKKIKINTQRDWSGDQLHKDSAKKRRKPS